jgi:hypothetical protein
VSLKKGTSTQHNVILGDRFAQQLLARPRLPSTAWPTTTCCPCWSS